MHAGGQAIFHAPGAELLRSEWYQDLTMHESISMVVVGLAVVGEFNPKVRAWLILLSLPIEFDHMCLGNAANGHDVALA